MEIEVERARTKMNYLLQYIRTTYIYSVLLVMQFVFSLCLLFYTLFTKIENFNEDFIFMMELILTIMYCLDIGLQIQTDRKKFLSQCINWLDMFILIVTFFSFLYFKFHFINNLIEDEENFFIISLLMIRIVVRFFIIFYRHHQQVKMLQNIQNIEMYKYNNQETNTLSQFEKDEYEIQELQIEQ